MLLCLTMIVSAQIQEADITYYVTECNILRLAAGETSVTW